MINKIIVTSTKYSQEGLDVSIDGDKLTVTKGKLIYDKEYELGGNVSFTIDEETVILFLVEELATGQVLAAVSDGSIDKTQYRLIERLAWKKDETWHKISIEPVPQTQRAGEYNYGSINKETIQKGLKILEGRKKTIGPDGQIRHI